MEHMSKFKSSYTNIDNKILYKDGEDYIWYFIIDDNGELTTAHPMIIRKDKLELFYLIGKDMEER